MYTNPEVPVPDEMRLVHVAAVMAYVCMYETPLMCTSDDLVQSIISCWVYGMNIVGWWPDAGEHEESSF